MSKAIRYINVLLDEAKEQARTANNEYSRENALGKISAYKSVIPVIEKEFHQYLKETENEIT